MLAEASHVRDMTSHWTWGPDIVVAVIGKRRVFVGQGIGRRLEAWNNSRIRLVGCWDLGPWEQSGHVRDGASRGKAEALTFFLRQHRTRVSVDPQSFF